MVMVMSSSIVITIKSWKFLSLQMRFVPFLWRMEHILERYNTNIQPSKISNECPKLISTENSTDQVNIYIHISSILLFSHPKFISNDQSSPYPKHVLIFWLVLYLFIYLFWFEQLVFIILDPASYIMAALVTVNWNYV